MPSLSAPSGMDPTPAAGMDAPPPTAEPGADGTASADALAQLASHLELDRPQRPELAVQPFATVPLTAGDAAMARELLWQELAAHVRDTRADEHAQNSITLDGFTLRYETVVLGDEPATGRDLFISMHGGGSGPASSNDSQWRNQVSLASGYAPEHALWVAPRAPTDDWNMWFKDHIEPLFDRLITNMIVFEGIDPDRVYLNGYSAGGDGVYGLAPRSADRWAGAGMSAGHPNGVSLANLRNVAFALHVGGNDSAFERNQVAQEYIELHRALQAADPGAYPFQGMVHPGLPHWMDLADAVSIPFLQDHTRPAAPERVVWEQHEIVTTRMYWLAVDGVEARDGTRVVARLEGQTVTIEELEGIAALRVRLDDSMLDLDLPVVIEHAGTVLFEDRVPRTAAALADTLYEREDPAQVYSGEILVQP